MSQKIMSMHRWSEYHWIDCACQGLHTLNSKLWLVGFRSWHVACRRNQNCASSKKAKLLSTEAGVPVCTNSGLKRNEPQTRNMLLGPWGWSMPEGHEGYSIWSKPLEERLRHKSQQNFNDGYMRNVSQYTVHCTLLRVGHYSGRLVRASIPTLSTIERD